MIVAVFIAACSQILLKRAAMKTYETKLAEYLNWQVVVAYGLFAFTVIVNMYVLRYIPLSFVPILESTGYVFVTFLSLVFLREGITRIKFCGMVLIVIGIIVFSL